MESFSQFIDKSIIESNTHKERRIRKSLELEHKKAIATSKTKNPPLNARIKDLQDQTKSISNMLLLLSLLLEEHSNKF